MFADGTLRQDLKHVPLDQVLDFLYVLPFCALLLFRVGQGCIHWCTPVYTCTSCTHWHTYPGARGRGVHPGDRAGFPGCMR